MNHMFFSLIFINLNVGFALFCIDSRTNSQPISHIRFFSFFLISSILIWANSHTFLSRFSAHIPLLIGFLFFLKSKLQELNDETKMLNSMVMVCEMTLIYLKTGRSFSESVHKSLNNLDDDLFKYEEIKKNVVMQQPKSRKSQLLQDFQHDLSSVEKIQVGKLEFLDSIKTKYSSLLALKRKIKTATTQYRAQSCTLILLWFLSFAVLVWQNKVHLHQKPVVLSFLMMIAGLTLSKKILIKTNFRI